MNEKKKTIYDFFLNQSRLKLCVLGLLILVIPIIFYSCSTEDESKNKAGQATETITKSEKIKTMGNTEIGLNNSLQENLNSLSEQVFVNTESLEIALYRNENIEFSESAIEMLNAATNENDLKRVFQMAGIANSQEVINILKSNVVLQQEFVTQNPSFYNLTTQQQAELLRASIEFAKISYNSHVPFPLNQQVVPKCGSAFNNGIGDCAEDFGICAVGAIYAASGGIWPGLIGGAVCMVIKSRCDSRVKRDYRECMGIKEPIDEKPPTSGLTIHCTEAFSVVDSCWTTDSNGRYVGRVN